QLDDNLLAAHIFITIPTGGGKVATVDGVKADLAEAGVVFGIDPVALENAVKEAQALSIPGMRWGPVLVAQGRSPVAGDDGKIRYHPCLTAASGRPKVAPDGTVNLFDLNVVHNVAKGTVLAVETPPTAGQPGMTVMGGEIPARPGRECWLKPGKGTELSEDKLTVTAACDGHATLMHGEISVTNIFQVNRDVGVETGNIQFVGSVVIRGNVQHGFSVKAEGDVEVQGGVHGGTIEAAGNITVQYGIKGPIGHGKVTAGGAVKAKFIEGADVVAGTNVWAADGILQSRVAAGASVEVLGRRGAVIGGHVSAQTSVSARILGSALGSTSEISVGVTPAARTELGENRKKQAELEEQLQRTNQAIQFLAEQERRGLLGPEKRATLAKLGPAQDHICATLETLKQRVRELEQMFKEGRQAFVEAKETCHPGVTVIIGGSRLSTTAPQSRARFKLNDDQEVEIVAAS
ncbi:MAG TPA: FapA family protein, partial [Chloroflexota bacterium]|nr:FapA family protein [Chloroflexota bacterium]